jgi:hypothetical protein
VLGTYFKAKGLARGEIAVKKEKDLSFECDEGKARPGEVPQ